MELLIIIGRYFQLFCGTHNFIFYYYKSNIKDYSVFFLQILALLVLVSLLIILKVFPYTCSAGSRSYFHYNFDFIPLFYDSYFFLRANIENIPPFSAFSVAT